MENDENYVYKAEVNWSLLTEGLTLPVDNQVIFARNMGRFLHRGEARDITLYLNGKGYRAQIRNVNFDPRFNRLKDTLQIRYPRDGELAQVLKGCFPASYSYIKAQRESRPNDDRSMIRLPGEIKEYLAIYTTQYEDSYILETIEAADMALFKDAVQNQPELVLEKQLDYEIKDQNAGILEDMRLRKIRKINKKIGENLKLLYGYRCQICGGYIGSDYGATRVIETHHIDYFVTSLNNDQQNQLIVCPNHHSIIHNVNPIFNKSQLIYIYPNGLREGLVLNQHLKPTYYKR